MGYDPNQPRDDNGQWGDGGGAAQFKNFKDGESVGGFPNAVGSPEQQNAVGYYQGSGPAINVPLRSGSAVSAAAGVHLKQLDSMFTGATLPQDTALWRGVDNSHSAFNNLNPGDSFLDKGFASTSLSPNIPRLFSGDGKMMKILAPKGASAILLRGASGPSIASQSEVLINRGSRYTFEGKDLAGNSVFRLGRDG
jgi:hypothetical protein